jgi:hypothetical protein
MGEQDKLDKIMTDVAVLLTKMDMVTQHITNCGALPTRVSLLEDTMSGVKKIMWGIGSVIGTAFLVAVIALIF